MRYIQILKEEEENIDIQLLPLDLSLCELLYRKNAVQPSPQKEGI